MPFALSYVQFLNDVYEKEFFYWLVINKLAVAVLFYLVIPFVRVVERSKVDVLLSHDLLVRIPTRGEYYYMLILPVIIFAAIEILPVIMLALIEILPVIEGVLSLLNFETTDLLTDNFELKFETFMIFISLRVFVTIYDTNLHRFQR